MKTDFHGHTKESDGAFGLEEYVSRAKAAGLEACAVTDHDQTNGAAIAALAAAGIRTCEAAEISALDEASGHSMHVLCYARNMPEEIHSELARVRREIRAWCDSRCAELAKRGIGEGPEAFAAWRASEGFGEWSTMTRTLGEWLASSEGARNRAEAVAGSPVATRRDFQRLFLNPGAPFSDMAATGVQPGRFPLAKLGAAAARAGAVLSVAHPCFSFGKRGGVAGFESRLGAFREMGVAALEVNAKAPEEWAAAARAAAERHGMLVTFGSDCHGAADEKHGDVGETHPSALRDPEWHERNVRSLLDRVS